MHWLWRSIELRIEGLARLNRQVEETRRALDEIQETTRGVTPREIEEDRFVVLPFGTVDNPPWTVRERPAVKPSRA